jgi:tellurite resistance protein TerC
LTAPLWAWLATLGVFAVLITLDLVFTRNAGQGLRTSAILSGLWIAAGLAFGGVLWLWQGGDWASEYYAGYLLEKALSVDNIFVFVLLFTSLGIAAAAQRRVLYLGVLGALLLRGGFIAAGGALIDQISWIFYVFGAMVLVAGARMLRTEPIGGGDRNLTVRAMRRVLPITDADAGDRFFIRVDGKVMATTLFVALVAIETTDLVFALDSIPAVFGVTRNLFIVFTSNAFAVLGLRALYFLLAGSMSRFRYLKQGLAVLLVFIGVKMLVSPVVHLPVTVSLAVIVGVVGAAVGASLWRDRARGSGERQDDRDRDREKRPVPG